MNKEKIKEGVKLILEGIGEDINRKELINTPDRIVELYEHIFSGINKEPEEVIDNLLDEKFLYGKRAVWIKDIEFYSVCEHHLLPFFGKVDIGYIPTNNKLIGISKLVELVDVLSKRLQLQERLTEQIANIIYKCVPTDGVKVIIKAEHLCLSMRKNKRTEFLTTANIGEPI